MPRYFFHVGGGVARPDPTGVDLGDLTEAWSEALQYARDLQAGPDGPCLGQDWHLVVTDQDGSFLFRLDFEGGR